MGERFRCYAELPDNIHCGGTVSLRPAGAGRTYRLLRGVDVAIPPDHMMMICGRCGESYTDLKQSLALQRKLIRYVTRELERIRKEPLE